MTDLIGQVCDLIEDSRFDAPLLGAWIYGGRAISPDSSVRDVDVLIVLREDSTPKRLCKRLYGGMPASLNIIGPNSLSAHSVIDNGGFYFSSKLLGPHILIKGDRDECQQVVANAISHMIYPWIMYMLPDSAIDKTFSINQIVALLYLLRIRISYHFVTYFARWRANPRFSEFWLSMCNITQDALAALTPINNLQVEQGGGIRFFMKEDRLPLSQLYISIEFLSSSFWQSVLFLREHEHSFLEVYFHRQIEDATKLSDHSIQETIEFLQKRAATDLIWGGNGVSQLH